MSKKQICLYTQTHWDREWYWEFEKYRNQLVSVARKIIDELESGSLPVFHLDGQTCALEDILEIEPELEDSIRALVKSRRLRIGPWYVLADQMLVSGESLVRNLERGMRIATKYGDPLMVGYLSGYIWSHARYAALTEWFWNKKCRCFGVVYQK